jgi:hypothetical protein
MGLKKKPQHDANVIWEYIEMGFVIKNVSFCYQACQFFCEGEEKKDNSRQINSRDNLAWIKRQ